MSWLSNVALSVPSIPGDGTRWEDWGELAYPHYERARLGYRPDNENDDVPPEMLIRYTARFLESKGVGRARPHLLALSGWLAVAQDDRARLRQAERVTR